MEKERSNERGITLIALIITIIIMLILAGVTVNVAIQGGLFGKAQEAKIETIIGMLKEEIWMEELGNNPENGTITAEQLLAKKKVGRVVEEEGQEGEEKYYLSYKIKDGAYESMQGLGKGVDKDIFLIDDNLNICYIDKKGRKYGDKDKIERTLLEDDTQIRFASPAFAAYVSKISGAKEDEMLFKWMKTQTWLDINDPAIDSLEDLVFFPNLKGFRFFTGYNEIHLKDLRGVEYCKNLDEVRIDSWNGVYIEDYSALSYLPNLKSLAINPCSSGWDSLIDTAKDIKSLTSFLSGGVSDMSRVGELEQIESLVLEAGSIEEMKGVENLKKLKYLTLRKNKISSTNGLEKLTGLTTLNLSDNQISNIESLAKLTNLKTLDLSNNQIENILPLASCSQLTSLNLKGNTTIRTDDYTEEEQAKLLEIGKIITERNGTINVDKEKLSLFKGYKSLDLSNQNLTDLKLLEGQTELTHLGLDNNQITLSDTESQNILKGMTNLKSLNIRNNNLEDLSAINSLQNLEQLWISSNNNRNLNLKQIEDIISNVDLYVEEATLKTIENCDPNKITKLGSLRYYDGELPDLSRFTHLETFSTLNADGITNLDVLSRVKSLIKLEISHTDLHGKMIDFSKLTNLKTLNFLNCTLWSEDLYNLSALKNNKNLSIDLRNNSIIDASALLELDESCKIDLRGNVNLSEASKQALREYFGDNVQF